MFLFFILFAGVFLLSLAAGGAFKPVITFIGQKNRQGQKFYKAIFMALFLWSFLCSIIASLITKYILPKPNLRKQIDQFSAKELAPPTTDEENEEQTEPNLKQRKKFKNKKLGLKMPSALVNNSSESD